METMVTASVDLDWVELFEGDLVSQGLGEKSLDAYLSDVRVFTKFYQEQNGQVFTPELLTSIDLREFQEWNLEHLSPGTWNRRMVSLQAMCRWAVKAGKLSYDPFQGLSRAEEVRLAPRWLEPREFKAFLREVEHQVQGAGTPYARRCAIRDQAMVGLMVYAGLREGEVAALVVGDVVLRERSGQVTVRLGKGKKRRTVPLGREARVAVKGWLDLVGDEDAQARLFTGKMGVPLSERGIQKVVSGIAEKAGLPDVTPHRLRHTFAKRALERGAKLTELQLLLGHEKLETTARYVTPGMSDLARAVEDL